MKRFIVLAVASILFATAACGGSRMAGTYSNENGSIVLDLKSSGTGSLTLLGESKPCTYSVGHAQLKLVCNNDQIIFDIHDDGSLTGPPDSMIGALKRSNS